MKLSTTDKPRDENTSEIRSSPSTSTTQTGRRGSLQLWQFLVALLDAPDSSAGCIAWTGRGMEFKLIEPEEVTNFQLIQKNKIHTFLIQLGCSSLGCSEKSPCHELRQIKQILKILLRKRNHAESGR